MIALAAGLRVYLACGATGIRKGMVGLAMLVQQSLGEDPFGVLCTPFAGAVPGCVRQRGGNFGVAEAPVGHAARVEIVSAAAKLPKKCRLKIPQVG